MVGIYEIKNKITNQSYIGQSKNIEQRFKEHIYHKNTLVGSEIEKYGIENFEFSILKECDEKDLDMYERKYISEYKTMYNGYNKLPGGKSVSGECNPNSKLTPKEVFAIREAYNNHEHKWDVYEKYKDKITKNSFSSLWQGNCWKDIHMDVYTQENKQYYMKETSIGDKGEYSLFTNSEVINMRYDYINKSAKEIYLEKQLIEKCNFQTLQQLLWGRSYSNLPIYDKKNKCWTNVDFVV